MEVTPLLIPEMEIYRALTGILAHARKDVQAQEPKNSFVYRLLGRSKLPTEAKFDFFQEVKKALSVEKGSKRYLDVSLMFDIKRENIPHIYISLAGEGNKYTGLGVNENFVPGEDNLDTNIFTPNLNVPFQTQINIVVVSDNSVEVLLLYTVIRAYFVALIRSLSLNGLQLPNLVGQDLQFSREIVPDGLFTRAIGFSCLYDVTVPAIADEIQIVEGGITVTGNPILPSP